MPSTQSYYDSLIAQSNAAAKAKKDALQSAYERLTTAQTDEKGGITYKKDASGNPMYGSMDVDYMQKKRMAGAGAESAGMMKSGQYARTLAEGQAAYRAGILGAKSSTTEQQTQIDKDLAMEQAKYKAMYGDTSTPGGGGATSTGGTATSPATSTPITAPPAPPVSGVRAGQSVLPTTGRGGMGSPGTVKVTPKPVPTPKPVTKKPGTVTIKPGGRY